MSLDELSSDVIDRIASIENSIGQLKLEVSPKYRKSAEMLVSIEKTSDLLHNKLIEMKEVLLKYEKIVELLTMLRKDNEIYKNELHQKFTELAKEFDSRFDFKNDDLIKSVEDVKSNFITKISQLEKVVHNNIDNENNDIISLKKNVDVINQNLGSIKENIENRYEELNLTFKKDVENEKKVSENNYNDVLNKLKDTEQRLVKKNNDLIRMIEEARLKLNNSLKFRTIIAAIFAIIIIILFLYNL